MSLRVAIYARRCPGKLSERSVAEQVRLCRERAHREGWKVVQVFSNIASSGDTRSRPGLDAMTIRAPEFDVILVEGLDRVSRDREQAVAFAALVRAAGCSLTTLGEGAIDDTLLHDSGASVAMFLRNAAQAQDPPAIAKSDDQPGRDLCTLKFRQAVRALHRGSGPPVPRSRRPRGMDRGGGLPGLRLIGSDA